MQQIHTCMYEGRNLAMNFYYRGVSTSKLPLADNHSHIPVLCNTYLNNANPATIIAQLVQLNILLHLQECPNRATTHEDI